MTQPSRGQDERTFLASYDPDRYPRIAVTVDMVLFTVRSGRFSVLLVRRKNHPYQGRWALPGGFVEPHEDLHQAAARELAEETGLAELPAGMHLEQLMTYGDPDRDPRMRVVSVAYLAFAPDLPPPRAGDDADFARFWPMSEVTLDHGGEGKADRPGPELAFDHARILADGVERARAKIEYTPLAAAFLEEPFTLSELRAIYEEVWGVPQDPASFRRKVLSRQGFVTSVGDIAPSKGGRPGDLYRRGEATQLWPPLRWHETEDVVDES
jgi:8-oxo-dGTP diphosphatase